MAEPQPFVWPPRPLPEDAPLPPEQPTPAPSRTGFAHRCRETLRAIERIMLEPTAEPLTARAAAAGWAPDPFDVYCERCGGSLGPHEDDEFGCSVCRGSRPPWSRVVRLGEFDGALRQWVHEVKFSRFWRLGEQIGALLAQRLRDAGIPERIAVVPMPTTLRRRLSRGVDHAGLIALGLARELDAPLVRALARAHRPSQRSVPASRRSTNVSGAFRRRRGARLDGRIAVLVDDVRTSGASARAACRALRNGPDPPAEVWLALVAVADDR